MNQFKTKEDIVQQVLASMDMLIGNLDMFIKGAQDREHLEEAQSFEIIKLLILNYQKSLGIIIE